MKNILFLFVLILLYACNSNTEQQSLLLSEQRAKTDTILAFQGIRISEPLDSLGYAYLMNNRPYKLYRKDKSSITLSDFVINGTFNIANLGDTIHILSLRGYQAHYHDFLTYICLYEDSYGCFSYYQRLNQNDESMGTFPICKMSKLSGKPYERMDAMTDFVKYGDSHLYKYNFVWEWNNQTIVLTYNPNISFLNSSITYFDKGYADKEAEQKLQKQLKKAKEKEIEESLNKQQI